MTQKKSNLQFSNDVKHGVVQQRIGQIREQLERKSLSNLDWQQSGK